ncbi:hypothetical protein C3941_11110 [Kaistia algarum]|nr:hypothetical protein C3941_11110 [Kaistia algarum]
MRRTQCGARKTTLGAGLALLHTVGFERRPGGQAMVAAPGRWFESSSRSQFRQGLGSEMAQALDRFIPEVIAVQRCEETAFACLCS